MTSRLPGLDLLRALAICLVLFYHYRHFEHPAWIDDYGKFGFTGVDLFFVLSGYLIASGLFRKLDWREFVLRRARRILPAYLLVVTIYFLWPTFQERSGISPVWRFLTFTQNYGLDLHHRGTFSHAWSLCVEEHFYAAMPLLLSAVKRRTLAYAMPVLVVLGMISRYVAWDDTDYATWYASVYYPTHHRLDGLIAGVTLAALMAYSPRAKLFTERRAWWLALSSMVVLYAAWWVTQDMRSRMASTFEFPLIALGYGLLVASALSIKWRFAVADVIAKLSFSTYLVHKGVYHVVQLGAEDPASTLTFVVCIVASFLVSAVIYMLVEQPALRAQTLEGLRRFRVAADHGVNQ